MGRWLPVVLLLGGCSASDPGFTLREGRDFGDHRRAVFELRTPDPAYAPAFAAHRSELEHLRARAGARTGFVQPELDAVRSFAIPRDWSDDDARTWAAGLDASWVVLRLRPVVSPEDIDPPTPSFVDAQGYRGSELGIGIDAVDLEGNGVTIHEVEYGWRDTHEDLVDVDLHPEPGQTVAADALAMGLAPEHGTATVGMLVAPHNGYGIDGLVPGVDIYTYPEWTEEGGLRRSDAIASAVTQADPGDIVMLQMQAQHPNTGQLGPAELEPDVWMLTRMASDAGVLVVAAGGNGALDLDGADADDYRALGDSGAILVGAALPDDRSPLPFSSFGDRIDLQGWGASVFSLGYGDFERFADDDDQSYTDTFEGTSSALPMVVAAASALTQAFTSAEGGPPDPTDVRRLLVATGRPQADGVHVGPLPDVAEAVAWAGAREADPPQVEIVDPGADLEVTIDLEGSVALEVVVDVDDASPIYDVQLEVDGAPIPLRAPPYAIDLEFEEGEHTLRARATDAWGNTATSETLTVAAVVEDKPPGSSSGDADPSGGGGDTSGGPGSDSQGSDCSFVARSRRPGRWVYMALIGFSLLRRRRRPPAMTST